MNRARRFARSRQFVRDRFSPEGYLGLHLTIGVLVVLLCGWCFSEIAETLGPSVPVLDQRVTEWSQQQGHPGLTSAARVLTFFGSVGFLSGASLGCALFLCARRAWNRLILLSVTMIGGTFLNVFLKHFFHRQRPVLENPLVTLTSYGFPSGHTMGATLFYGVLVLLAVRAIPELRWRLIIALFASLAVVVIGATRIYLGAHYLTDVLAAMAAGLVWLSICWTAVEIFRRRKVQRARHGPNA